MNYIIKSCNYLLDILHFSPQFLQQSRTWGKSR